MSLFLKKNDITNNLPTGRTEVDCICQHYKGVQNRISHFYFTNMQRPIIPMRPFKSQGKTASLKWHLSRLYPIIQRKQTKTFYYNLHRNADSHTPDTVFFCWKPLVSHFLRISVFTWVPWVQDQELIRRAGIQQSGADFPVTDWMAGRIVQYPG